MPGSNGVTGARRRARWSVGVVVASLLVGATATRVDAQEGGAEPPPARPPADNVFPVALPHEVSFGDSWHACRDGCQRRHKGTDIMAPEGAPLVAVESGVVAKVRDADEGLGGRTVWLRGDSGVAYYYAHNSANLVTEGQRVARGQPIARVGRTGNARTTPPHVHFQINLCGELSSAEPCTVNPFPYVRRWVQVPVDGGPDGVGWYRPDAATFGRRTEVGSPLPDVVHPDVAGDEVPVAGDWDGDGRDSLGVYRRSDATFRLLDDEGRPIEPIPFGEPGRTDVWPVAGDFDGDGRDTVGLYRRADATFVVLVSGGGASAPVAVGDPGRDDTFPVVGDWDGDGRDAVGVYRQADGVVARVDDDGTPLPPTRAAAWGPEVLPVAGDWDGDGRDDVAVLRRDTGTFELPGGDPEAPGGIRVVEVGALPGALPVAGDWNGRELVTLEELSQIFGPLPDEAAVAEGLPALNAAMLRAGISTPERKAAFLATLRNESGFRVDAVEAGDDSRWRGRGLIQLTGEHNYRAAAEDLGLDLVGNPDLALHGLASPAIAAWYWTVARDVNVAADARDMAAVNIAVGYEPTERRDARRCADFVAALRFYSGEAEPEGVNCERTAESRRLAFSAVVPLLGGSHGAPTGRFGLAPDAVPDDWRPGDPVHG